ncbi:MAG: hypothetical protein HY511_08300 [Actinobacteria bacterium]|nr:hypothetical protein [Actinomycetota bacterium]
MTGVKTFVIRLFVPAEQEFRSDALHGVIEEVAGGRSAVFGDGEELLTFLEQAGAGPTPTERLVTLGSEEK